MLDAKVAIIVPTLGSRNDFLLQCLSSVRAAGRCHIVVVAPSVFDYSPLAERGLLDQFVPDPGGGPAAAINEAARQLPTEITYFNWLGDDDQLTPDSIDIAVGTLELRKADFVWGSCRYVDKDGNSIGINRSGSWAKTLMKVGPDLIPQPGALFARKLFDDVGGLDASYRLAFDYDLFMKFTIAGKCVYIRHILADYRWHPDALSAGSRLLSVREARAVRRAYLPKWLRPMSPMWDRPVSFATYMAGRLLSTVVKSRNVDTRTQ